MPIRDLLRDKVIFRFCIKCGIFLGIKPGHGVLGISHGICEKCLAEIRKNK